MLFPEIDFLTNDSWSLVRAEANGNGEHAQPGQENLYLYDNASGRTSYLATGAQLLQISTVVLNAPIRRFVLLLADANAAG